MTDDLKKIWAKVDARNGPQRMETEAEHIARDMREGNFPKRSDPIQVPANQPRSMTDAPERTYIRWGKTGNARASTPASAGAVANCEGLYILATYGALSEHPAVKALVAEAEARGMERAAKACDRRAGNASDFGRYTRRAAGMCAADIRAVAAAIRETKP